MGYRLRLGNHKGCSQKFLTRGTTFSLKKLMTFFCFHYSSALDAQYLILTCIFTVHLLGHHCISIPSFLTGEDISHFQLFTIINLYLFLMGGGTFYRQCPGQWCRKQFLFGVATNPTSQSRGGATIKLFFSMTTTLQLHVSSTFFFFFFVTVNV